jgi:hypothetical protein
VAFKFVTSVLTFETLEADLVTAGEKSHPSLKIPSFKLQEYWDDDVGQKRSYANYS